MGRSHRVLEEGHRDGRTRMSFGDQEKTVRLSFLLLVAFKLPDYAPSTIVVVLHEELNKNRHMARDGQRPCAFGMYRQGTSSTRAVFEGQW